jgi:hypothetical protein
METDAQFEETLFNTLSHLADKFGWELTKRDPGPELDTVNDSWPYCDIDTGWCRTHDEWIDEHEWKLPITSDLIDPKADWTEAQIEAASEETRRLTEVLTNERTCGVECEGM